LHDAHDLGLVEREVMLALDDVLHELLSGALRLVGGSPGAAGLVVPLALRRRERLTAVFAGGGLALQHALLDRPRLVDPSLGAQDLQGLPGDRRLAGALAGKVP
jgi:hypothetical protein